MHRCKNNNLKYGKKQGIYSFQWQARNYLYRQWAVTAECMLNKKVSLEGLTKPDPYWDSEMLLCSWFVFFNLKCTNGNVITSKISRDFAHFNDNQSITCTCNETYSFTAANVKEKPERFSNVSKWIPWRMKVPVLHRYCLLMPVLVWKKGEVKSKENKLKVCWTVQGTLVPLCMCL